MKTRITLLEEVSGGSEDAWSEVAGIYRPLIFGWLRKFELQPSDAEDLTQDVLTALFSNIERFGHNGRIGAFRTWLRTITQNRAVDFLRQRNRSGRQVRQSSFHDMVQQLEDPKSSVSQIFDRQHDLHLLSRLLERVTSEFEESTMEIFSRHVVQGIDALAIAGEFGVSRHAVYMAKSRVMRRLRELAPGFIEDMERDERC